MYIAGPSPLPGHSATGRRHLVITTPPAAAAGAPA